jgi:hypothetical protein
MVSRETVIQHLEQVPDEAMDEVLDFIDFVAERRGRGRRDRAMELLQESSMTSVWNTPDDEVWNDVPSR